MAIDDRTTGQTRELPLGELLTESLVKTAEIRQVLELIGDKIRGPAPQSEKPENAGPPSGLMRLGQELRNDVRDIHRVLTSLENSL